MHQIKKILRQDAGVTLIELLIVIAVVGILAGLASLGFGLSKQQRLATMAKELHSDLQKARMDALTRSSSSDSRGFGLSFPTDGAYRTFEFVDNQATDFVYEGTTEEANSNDKSLSTGFTVTLGASSSPSGIGNVLVFDKRGFARNKDWALVPSRVYVLALDGVSEKRCVSLSRTRIREGRWDGANCDEI